MIASNRFGMVSVRALDRSQELLHMQELHSDSVWRCGFIALKCRVGPIASLEGVSGSDMLSLGRSH